MLRINITFRDFQLYSAVPWDIWHKYMGDTIPNCIKTPIQPTNIWFGGCYCICNLSSATLGKKCIKCNSCERQKEGGKYPHGIIHTFKSWLTELFTLCVPFNPIWHQPPTRHTKLNCVDSMERNGKGEKKIKKTDFSWKHSEQL